MAMLYSKQPNLYRGFGFCFSPEPCMRRRKGCTTFILFYLLLVLLYLAAQANGAAPWYAPDPYADGVYSSTNVHWPGDATGQPDQQAAIFFGPGSQADYTMGQGEAGTDHLLLHLLGTAAPADILIVYLNDQRQILDSTELHIGLTAMSEPSTWFVFYGGNQPYAQARVQVLSGALLLDAIQATSWQREPDVWLPIVGIE